MTPRLSIIGAAIRSLLGATGATGDIGKYADEYWSSVVLALRGNVPVQDFKTETVLNMHMDGADPDWGSVVLGMRMGGGEVDPYWSNVSLLMLMNGTNGSTAIGDVTGKTVTVAGNAQISTTQSKFGGSSCYFDGTGDYLSIPNNTGFNFGTNDFTIETWIYISGNSILDPGNKRSASIAVFGSQATANSESWWFSILGDGTTTGTGLTFDVLISAVTTSITVTTSISQNTWHHVAVSRVGNVTYLFLNGNILTTSTAFSGKNISGMSSNPLTIGTSLATNYFRQFKGYLDNFRITKGISRYTDNFTPPRREFPAGATTIYDVKGHPSTLYGNTTLTNAQSRFGGYSCYFDVTGDYLDFGNNGDWAFGASPFTIEFWMYVPTNITVNKALVNRWRTASSGLIFDISLGNNNTISYQVSTTGAYQAGNSIGSASNAFSAQKWHHVAFVRSGDVFTLYVDGVSKATHSPGAITLYAGNSSLLVGLDSDGSRAFTGYIDDLRITKGVARYTANFTPPSRAFPHDVAFLDEKGLVPAIAGTPSISTGTLKYGYGSASFNGTTDYLTFDASSNFGLGTNDFTIEAWVKTSAAGTLLDFRNYAADYGHFYLATGGYLAFDHTYGAIVGTTTVTDNNWHHVAFVRYKNILTLYVDGVDTGASIANANIGSNRQARVGAKVNGTNFFAGNLDELRVTKVARYVGEFTPQRYQFDDANNNVIWRDETGTKTITPYGDAQVYPATYKYGNASVYFDGAGDYLSVPTSADLNFGTGDFTIEFWFNYSGSSVTYPIFMGNNNGSWSAGAIAINCDTTAYVDKVSIGCYDYHTTNRLLLGTSTITYNAWHHVAIVRSGNQFQLFYDGALEHTNTSTASLDLGKNNMLVGGGNWDATNSYYTGFLDDLRITKGIARYVSNFTPPVRQNANYGVPALYDPYWDAVVLGMHMDGADTGTTFTDVKGKTVSVFGNTNTVTATKKFGTASAYFDGTGDYLSLATTSDFGFGTGDFTVECWIYITAGQGIDRNITDFRSSGGNDVGTFFIDGPTNKLAFWHGAKLGATGTALTTSTWYHVALCRANGVFNCYLNGVLDWTATATVNFGATRPLSIGASIATGIVGYGPFTGYIDNLRITKGVARYTANFQPAQYAFPETRTPVKTYLDPYYDNVVLNMHMNGPSGSTAFVDEKGKTVTAYGNAVLSSTQSKFGGVSAYFDGTGDYLSIPHSSDFDISSGDFTIECWAYLNSLASSQGIIDKRSSLSAQGISIYFDTVGGSAIHFVAGDSDTTNWEVNLTFTPVVNTWYHLAFVRIGTTFYALVNGVIIGQTAWAGTIALGTNPFYIGVLTSSTTYLSGYIDDLRITKGVARYTQSFTVPALPNPDFKLAPAATDPYWKNVVLHMPMNGADAGTTFTENTGKTVTVNGNTQTKVAQYRFGGSSAYFDGTGDYLTVSNSADLNLTTGDFTVEFWMNVTSATADSHLVGRWSGSNTNGSWHIGVGASGVLFFELTVGGSYESPRSKLSSTGVVTAGVWYHMALVRSANVFTLYCNGTSVLTHSDAITLYNSTLTLSVGANDNGAQPFTGYIDDLMITKGVARYTANFTPPSVPNPTGYDPYAPNVVLHLPMAADFNDGTGKTVTVNGNTVISTTVKKLGAGSGYFDGTGDYLSTPTTADFAFGTGDYSIESWVYLSALGAERALLDTRAATTDTGLYLYVSATNFPTLFGNNAAIVTGSTALVASTWYHLAAVKVSGTVTLYLNGVSIGSAASAYTVTCPGSVVIGRKIGSTTNDWIGNVSDIRVTSKSRYTTTFTPPREPFSLT